MEKLIQDFYKLNIDGSYIGFEKGDTKGGYFCTPVGARVIGWDNGIHYCTMEDFVDMIFCVNPETCCDYYAYPIAENFEVFLSLTAAAKNTNALQQIVLWDKQQYESFVNSEDNTGGELGIKAQQQIDVFCSELGIAPHENPFGYVKNLQKNFDYKRIKFNDEFYDITGIENPDGTHNETTENGWDFATAAFEVDI